MDIRDDSPRLQLLFNFIKNLRITFEDIALIDAALTHRSFINEGGAGERLAHNERLEFLGDAVLGQAVASILYRRLESGAEGDLARIKSIVVSEHTLATIAADIGIAEALRMGRGEELSGGRAKKAMLADALEALIGALFLDQGSDEAQNFVERLFAQVIEERIAGQSKDYKTIVQEYAQKYLKTLPGYSLEKTEGPEHDRVFWVTCRLDGKSYGPFPGKTKKEAEQRAAENLFSALKSADPQAGGRLAAIAGLSSR